MKIAVMTSGGDAPGMNAAIRAVVRTATYYRDEAFVVKEGYRGLVEGKIERAGRFSDCINHGGTLLKTSRLPEFERDDIQQIAANNLRELGIENLVVIGGDGSYRGALGLSRWGINCMCVPGTIDNDIASSDYTIGFDTALDTILQAVDRLRDTSSSHQRCTLVEVMGRRCGDLAIYAGVCSGAELVITNETGFDKQFVLDEMKKARLRGKQHAIIIITEGVTDSTQLAKDISEYTGFGCRATILGHVQRGGNPTGNDRILASQLGSYAVDVIHEGKCNRAVGKVDGKLVNYDIAEALEMKPKMSELYELIKKLG